MEFVVTPKEFEAAIRKAGKNPRGPTRASVEAVIRKYRGTYAKRLDEPLSAPQGDCEQGTRGRK